MQSSRSHQARGDFAPEPSINDDTRTVPRDLGHLGPRCRPLTQSNPYTHTPMHTGNRPPAQRCLLPPPLASPAPARGYAGTLWRACYQQQAGAWFVNCECGHVCRHPSRAEMIDSKYPLPLLPTAFAAGPRRLPGGPPEPAPGDDALRRLARVGQGASWTPKFLCFARGPSAQRLTVHLPEWIHATPHRMAAGGGRGDRGHHGLCGQGAWRRGVRRPARGGRVVQQGVRCVRSACMRVGGGWMAPETSDTYARNGGVTRRGECVRG